MNTLFALRLGFYLVLVVLPLFHPAVVQYTDESRFWFFFALIPGEILAARLKSLKLSGPAGLLLLGIPFLVSGLTGEALGQAGMGTAAWISTRLIFHRGCRKLLYPEPFCFGVILFRILRLSRSSQQMAEMSRTFDLVCLLFLLSAFLIYTFLIYRAEYTVPESASRPLPLLILLLLVAALVLPAAFFPRGYRDFIRRVSTPKDPFQAEYRPVEGRGSNLEMKGNLQGDRGGNRESRRGDPGEGEVSTSLLTGPPGRWDILTSGESGHDVQHLVMIVRSEEEPVYLADRYYGRMDPAAGMQADGEYYLNALPEYQLLESWINPEVRYGVYRVPVRTDIYSTISDRVSSYFPYKLEPAVQNRTYAPLSYSYRALSMISRISLEGFMPYLTALSPRERAETAPWLEVNMEPEDRAAFEALAGEILDQEDAYGVRIRKILMSFSDYQYNIGFSELMSVEAVSRFLFETRSGDCTEFSHSAAILGRLASIPSRVVTGYLMSDALQTPAHRQGIRELRKRYPPLKEENPDELYLVTTSHRHSWVQFYLPRYGWVDFESTAYAIPPLPGGNPNLYDVVIPDLSEREAAEPAVPIPWFLLLRLTGGALAAVLLSLYCRRWYRMIYLMILSRRPGEQGQKALYRLLLIRLRARGYSLKSPDMTPAEYAGIYPELAFFAELYTRSLYSPSPGREDALRNRERLRREYRTLLKRKRSPLSYLKEIFSLRSSQLFLILMLLPLLGSCGRGAHWNEFRGRQGLGQAPAAVSPPVAVKWQFLLQEPQRGRRYFNQPLLVDRTIYFGSSDGNFYSMNLDTGYMNWVFRTEGPINSVAYADRDRVYFGSGDRYVYALDRESGNEIWRFETGGSVSSTIVPYGDLICVSSDRDAYYLLNRDGGEALFLDNPVWHRNAFQINGHLLAFAPGPEESNHRLGVYDLEKREFLWTLDTEEEDYHWFSFPVIRKGSLYYSAVGVDQEQNMIFRYSCHDAESGDILWSVTDRTEPEDLPGEYSTADLYRKSAMLLDYGAPLIRRNRVIYASGDHKLRCFHSRTGEPVWEQVYSRPVTNAPVMAGDRIYFGLHEVDTRGLLVCASAVSGDTLWEIGVEGSILNSPVIAGRWILFGTDRGIFYVLEEVF